MEIIRTKTEGLRLARAAGAGCPLIHVHFEERTIHGNGIAIKIWGEMKIAAKEIVYARELKLNTLEVLLLTPHTGAHVGYNPQKWIYNKGQYDNYASIDIYNMDGTEITAGLGPDEGSLWLDYVALGE